MHEFGNYLKTEQICFSSPLHFFYIINYTKSSRKFILYRVVLIDSLVFDTMNAKKGEQI